VGFVFWIAYFCIPPLSALLYASSLFPFWGLDLVCFQVCGGALKTLVLPCYKIGWSAGCAAVQSRQ